MSVEPPSSGNPTGPPSGPLSGPSQPSSGPPDEPHRPWWRSAPRIALATTAVVAVTAVTLLLTRSSGDSGDKSGSGEVFLQAAAKPGPDPFTESTAAHSSAPPTTPAPSQAPEGTLRSVDGGSAGLYGGSRDVAACDVQKQIRTLGAAPAKNRAFATVAGVQPAEVPSYLRSLTPVQLRTDTRVTNHGFRDGAATSYQSVLQTGTAVLVDGYGVPRVRCACGNPLTRARAQSGAPRPTGDTWPAYRPANVVVVAPSVTVINIFVLYDHDDHGWIARHRGDSGHGDRPTTPPVTPTPTPTPSPSPSPSVTPSPSTSPSESPSPSPSPSPSTSPSSPSPSPESASPSASPSLSPSLSPALSLSPSPSPPTPLSASPLEPSPLTATPSPTGTSTGTPSPSSGEPPSSPGV
ncbi:DUF6777 domain-containing protein [Streptomyces acidiscabies]|uniref:DUF6777 domain-containing protein n=1 Tax=Streptomyces acidiscabies TaxID=42234 RepID=UPI0009607A8C|nr:DUF6777 domain-containing protein [Streptomyces acidiscabies]GAV39395.1 hypothetical protein Saa2_02280 [Streptomyces acidiscabies]